MKTYFTTKLKNINEQIERTKDNIVKYANELDIKSIISSTEHLTSLKISKQEFTKDACVNLTVDEVIELLKLELFDKYKAAYVFRYDKAISIGERDKLSSYSWEFKDAKIK